MGQSSGQMAKMIDSLKTIVNTSKSDTVVLNAIYEWDNLIFASDPKKDLALLTKACQICEKVMKKPMSKKEKNFFKKNYGNFLNNLAIAYTGFNDFENGLIVAHKALKEYNKWGDSLQIAKAYNNVGTIYAQLEATETARKYFLLAIEYINDSTSEEWADAQNNLAGGYFNQKKYSKALKCYLKALKAYETLNDEDQRNLATTFNNIGEVYNKLGEKKLSLKYLQVSLDLNLSSDDAMGSSSTYQSLAQYYFENRNSKRAIENAKLALKYANLSEVSILKKDANKLLYEIYKSVGLSNDALVHFELFSALRDSILAEDSKYFAFQQDIEFEYQGKNLKDSLEFVKNLEVETAVYKEQEKKQKLQLVGLLFIAVLIITIAVIIYKSKQKSEKLLLNILPKEIAKELKNKGQVDATLIKNTTVLFTDFKGFTALSEILSPKNLVQEINVCFSAFDHIMGKHNIEKIKTIGDAYMAAGGLPSENKTHANDVVKAALEIQEFMLDLAEKKKAKGEPYFEIRIGIHTGPVVAGIVGVKKFQYDIWGDTVNTASRMESSGGVGKVNVSESTYEIVKDNLDFTFESRGKVEAKGKGMLEMFFVEKKTFGRN